MLSDTFGVPDGEAGGTTGVPDGGTGGTTGVPETGVSVEMISVACDCAEACAEACDCAEATLLRARLCLRARSACIASYWNVSLSISDSGLFAELEITTRSAANM